MAVGKLEVSVGAVVVREVPKVEAVSSVETVKGTISIWSVVDVSRLRVVVVWLNVSS